MGTPSSSPTFEEQIFHYRQMATEALAMAGRTTDKTARAAYLVMASDWHRLAAELEHDLETFRVNDRPS